MSMPEVALECLHCHGACETHAGELVCGACGAVYRTLLGIPDMRVTMDAWIDFDSDWALATKLAASYATSTFEDIVKSVWAERRHIPPAILERRLHGIASESRKHAGELAPGGWMNRLELNSPLLEIGCGTGGFLIPAASRAAVVGVDVSMAWMIAAKKRLEEAGQAAQLVCACAENLPFRKESFRAVVAFDVLEHVHAIDPVIAEVIRVTAPGGLFVATTPNRYSLTAEPHVGLWGVGLLPRKWMVPYVEWRRGIDYRHTHLQSLWDLRRRLGSRMSVEVKTPEIWPEDAEQFGFAKRRIAYLYNAILRADWLGKALLPVAPFFRVIARRRKDSR